LGGCKGGIKDVFLPSSTGKPYEVLVVLNEGLYDGNELFAVLKDEVKGLPQIEPLMDVSHVSVSNFTGFLRYARNILYVEIDSSYCTASLSLRRNKWAKDQVVVFLSAPNAEVLNYFLSEQENRERLIESFYRTECLRKISYYKEHHNSKAGEILFKNFQISFCVPEEMTQIKEGKNFFWATDGKESSCNLVVYAVPYDRKDAFAKERLLEVRDSVMKRNLFGGLEGSYMQTSIYPVSHRVLSINNKYCVEMRGLWEMKNDMMGGPFVSFTRLDEINQRIVTAEVFVFAPSQKKRNLLKGVESSLYTMKLCGEEMLPEVKVSPQER